LAQGLYGNGSLDHVEALLPEQEQASQSILLQAQAQHIM
jgi:hypothetical protein